MSDESRRIVEKEIDRLKKAYEAAQDRYAYTGSRSTDNTMYKYSVLQDALTKSLAGPTDEEERLLRRIDDMRENIANAEREIKRLQDAGEIMPGYAGRIIRIMEGKER